MSRTASFGGEDARHAIGESWGYSFSRAVMLSRAWQLPATARALRNEAAAAKIARDYAKMGAKLITVRSHQFESGVALLYQNGERSWALEETLTLDVTNLERLGGGRERVVEVAVPPGGEELLVFKRITHAGFSFGYRSSSRVKRA